MKNKLVKNTLILSVFLLISKFLGAVYRIPLSNILGTEGIGLYQMVFPVYSLFLVFITGSMPTYVAQQVSMNYAKKKFDKINNIVKLSLVISILYSVFATLLLIVFSSDFAILQGNYKSYLGYDIVALSIIFSSVTCVYKGYFQGMENMVPSATCGVVEQLAKLCFGLTFALFLKDKGQIYAVGGAFLGVLISEIISFVYMTFIYLVKSQHTRTKTKIKYKELKTNFLNFLPLSFSNIILPFSSCIDTFLVVNLLIYSGINSLDATSLFGIATGMVAPLVNFPILFFGTVATAMIPSLTYNIATKKDINKTIEGAFFFVWLICLPCAFGILGTSKNILSIFFPSIENKYINVSILYLSISSFNILWMSLIQISSSTLNSFGQFKLPLLSQMLGLFIKIICLVFFILFTNLNILSLVIAITISQFFVCVLDIIFVKKLTNFKLGDKQILIPIFASITMYLTVFYLNKFLIINEYIKFVILLLSACIVYFSLCFIFKIITLKNIKDMFNSKKFVNNINDEQ